MRKLIESTFVTLDGVVDDTTPSSASHAAAAKGGSPYWTTSMGPMRTTCCLDRTRSCWARDVSGFRRGLAPPDG
jgi:hypothetical protein